MCADFTASYVGGPQGSPIQPQQAVVDDSLAVGLSSFANILNSGSSALMDYTKQAQANAKEQAALQLQATQDQAVANFSQEQLKLADAVEMGDLSSSEARMRMRANLTRYIADNPAIAVDLGKAHTSVVKTSGLGQSVYEGTEAEKQQSALEAKAVEAGWVRPDMPAEQKAEAAYAYVQFQRNLEMMEAESKQIALQSAKVGLTTAGIQQESARLTLQEKQATQRSRAALGGLANNYQVKLGNDLEAIRQAKERGEIDALQANMMIDNAMLAVTQLSSQIGAEAGSEYISNMTAPMRAMADNYKRYTSGEIQLNDLNARNETQIALQVNNALGDPKMARLAALNKVLSNAGPVAVGEISTAAQGFLEGNIGLDTKPADVLPDYKEGKDGLKTYTNILSDAMRKLNQGTALDPEQTTEQVNANITNILRGIEVYGPTVSSPTEYNGVMDFLSSPEFGKYITKQGGLPDSAAAFKAAQTLEFEYSNVVLPLIKQEYERTKAGGEATMSYYGRTEVPGMKNQKATPALIKPQFLGSGVTFVADPSAKDSFTRNRVKELNNKVSPVLNRLIRTTAHLEGTTNYQSVFKERFANIFEEAEAQANEEGNN